MAKSLGDKCPQEGLKQRLEEILPDIETIKELCGVASISIGVLDDGKIAYTKSVGFRDATTRAPPDADSLYTLCSVSKTFVSACFGILVERGCLAWDKTPRDYLELDPEGDASLAYKATFNEIFRHSGGLDNPVVSILGYDGKVLVPQDSFIDVLNNTPTERHGRTLLNSWVYSNVGYGLAVLVIEKVSQIKFSQFLQEQILGPLGMKHTAVTASQAKELDNAHSYAQMQDGTWKQLKHEWTDENNSPILAMVGIRSSVNDMMIYIAAMMQAYLAHKQSAPESSFEILSKTKYNPIKQIGAILDDHYWTRLANIDDGDGDEARYHLGWIKVPMPNCMVSWGSWNDTLADNAPKLEHPWRDSKVLGRKSEKRLLIKSTGIGFGGTCSMNWLPKTRTGIVVFSSGASNGDAADFTASLILQTIFNLQPKVDIIAMVEHEVEFKKKAFTQLIQDIEDHRNVSHPESDHAQYIGEYSGLGITLTIRKATNPDGMEICFNSREDTARALEYYNKDQYSYWPKSRDEYLEGGWLDWDYYLVGILSFKRDEAGTIMGVTWVWEEGAEPYLFRKTK